MLQVKIYQGDTIKEVVPQNEVMGQISFTASINSGQGEATIRLKKPISYIPPGNIIKLIAIDANNPQGKVVYSGRISDIARIFDVSQSIEIRVLGLFAVMNFVDIAGTQTKTHADHLEWIISQVNAVYNYFSTDIESIGGSSFAKTFDGTAIDAITSLDQGGYSWFVDADGIFSWKNKNNQPIHIFTVGNNLEKVTVKDLYEDDGFLVTPKRSITATIYNYNIYSILPGHRISLRNIGLEVNNSQIHKVTYNDNRVTIEVEKIDSISSALQR